MFSGISLILFTSYNMKSQERDAGALLRSFSSHSRSQRCSQSISARSSAARKEGLSGHIIKK